MCGCGRSWRSFTASAVPVTVDPGNATPNKWETKYSVYTTHSLTQYLLSILIWIQCMHGSEASSWSTRNALKACTIHNSCLYHHSSLCSSPLLWASARQSKCVANYLFMQARLWLSERRMAGASERDSLHIQLRLEIHNNNNNDDRFVFDAGCIIRSIHQSLTLLRMLWSRIYAENITYSRAEIYA